MGENKISYSPSGVLIADEEHEDVGVNSFALEHDTFFDGADLEIWTGEEKTGTKLVQNTDYTVSEEISRLSTKVGKQVFSKIAIINGVYQQGKLYITYKTIGDFAVAEDYNFIEERVNQLILVSNSNDAKMDWVWPWIYKETGVYKYHGDASYSCSFYDGHDVFLGRGTTITKYDRQNYVKGDSVSVGFAPKDITSDGTYIYGGGRKINPNTMTSVGTFSTTLTTTSATESGRHLLTNWDFDQYSGGPTGWTVTGSAGMSYDAFIGGVAFDCHYSCNWASVSQTVNDVPAGVYILNADIYKYVSGAGYDGSAMLKVTAYNDSNPSGIVLYKDWKTLNSVGGYGWTPEVTITVSEISNIKVEVKVPYDPDGGTTVVDNTYVIRRIDFYHVIWEGTKTIASKESMTYDGTYVYYAKDNSKYIKRINPVDLTASDILTADICRDLIAASGYVWKISDTAVYKLNPGTLTVADSFTNTHMSFLNNRFMLVIDNYVYVFLKTSYLVVLKQEDLSEVAVINLDYLAETGGSYPRMIMPVDAVVDQESIYLIYLGYYFSDNDDPYYRRVYYLPNQLTKFKRLNPSSLNVNEDFIVLSPTVGADINRSLGCDGNRIYITDTSLYVLGLNRIGG